MKFSAAVNLLLLSNVAAQAPAGTATIDGGKLPAAEYSGWKSQIMDGVACSVTKTCTDSPKTSATSVCAQVTLGDAVRTGVCMGATDCGKAQLIDTLSYTTNCNTATTAAGGKDLDIVDFLAFTAATKSWTACPTAGCATAGETCVTLTLKTASATRCAVMKECDITGKAITGSTNKTATTCAGDAYLTWKWQAATETAQKDNAACPLSDPPLCTDGTNLCGTATVDKWTQIGCYPVADCTALGGTVTGSTTAKYVLACDSMRVLASAASLAVAALYM
jgi:hypothetical protein